jgi:rRNA pseudouridine-1189 N-methylase Emg1 (Nep1/Mra1 family)
MKQNSEAAALEWAVYQCQKLGRGETPKDEVLVSAHFTASEAMDEANRRARADRTHTYTVGFAW